MLCLFHKWEYMMVEDHDVLKRYIGRRCRCGRREILWSADIPPVTREEHGRAVTTALMRWGPEDKVLEMMKKKED